MEGWRCNGTDAKTWAGTVWPSKLTPEDSKNHSKPSNNASKAPTLIAGVLFYAYLYPVKKELKKVKVQRKLLSYFGIVASVVAIVFAVK